MHACSDFRTHLLQTTRDAPQQGAHALLREARFERRITWIPPLAMMGRQFSSRQEGKLLNLIPRAGIKAFRLRASRGSAAAASAPCAPAGPHATRAHPRSALLHRWRPRGADVYKSFLTRRPSAVVAPACRPSPRRGARVPRDRTCGPSPLSGAGSLPVRLSLQCRARKNQPPASNALLCRRQQCNLAVMSLARTPGSSTYMIMTRSGAPARAARVPWFASLSPSPRDGDSVDTPPPVTSTGVSATGCRQGGRIAERWVTWAATTRHNSRRYF